MRGSVGVVPPHLHLQHKKVTNQIYLQPCRPLSSLPRHNTIPELWTLLTVQGATSQPILRDHWISEDIRIHFIQLIMYNIMIYKTRLYHTLTPHNQETPWFTINHWNSPRRIPLKLGARLHRNGSLQQTGSHSARPCRSLATDGKHEDVSYPRLWSACGQHTALPFGKVPKIRKRETNKGKTSVSLTCTLKGMNWMNWSLKTFNFDGRVITCLYNIHARSIVFQSIGLTCPGRK